ncbi:hypothetical protein BOX15_Mlig015648g1 [Macrostomum lignano]|uniref:Chromatin target of PRMT1 protein C-terminal domain-containing protein n=1 Tax=Macrostomum lignano TaxID=282301 RepID=A0A267FJX0_9PLAT|nr:hypothetical protein BOX15_Mlig015648g1 [Macrostomum lignano]
MAGRLPVKVKLGDGTSRTLNDRFTQLQSRQGRQQVQQQRAGPTSFGRAGFAGSRRLNGGGGGDGFMYDQRLRGVQDGRVERRSAEAGGRGGFQSVSYGQQRGGFRGRGRITSRLGGLNRSAVAANFAAGGGGGPRRGGGGGPPRYPRLTFGAGGGRGGRGFGGGGGGQRGRSRGRGGRGSRGGGGGGGGGGSAANKEALDRELDAYMQNTGSALNRDLNAYYSDAKMQNDF